MNDIESIGFFTHPAVRDTAHRLPLQTIFVIFKAMACAALASCAAILYSELLFVGTRSLYQHGRLLRYYPLTQERHAWTAWLNAFSFIAPTALFATLYQSDIERSWSFNPISLLLYTALYLVIHDVYFYEVHSSAHKFRILYNYFHAMHHEFSYAMNVYIVGYAEASENFVQVGVPWMLWTWIASGNWWNWLLPLSLIVFTTLIGHSGYKMSWEIAVFHPLVLPFVLLTGSSMLTPGDHQMHHSHRRCNYGLFWRLMDRWHGTYRKCEVRAHDIGFWRTWSQNKAGNSEEAKKWLRMDAVHFEQVEWGF